MASPSFGDIVKAIELCIVIQEKCLETHLKQFRSAFDRASAHLDDEQSVLAPNQAGSVAAAIKREAVELVGDFKSTLEECDALLKKHVKLGSRGAKLLDNAFWHATTQGKVDNLRARLQSHTHKIWLIVVPVDLHLQSHALDAIYEIRALLTSQFGNVDVPGLPNIQLSVENRFRDALRRNPPVPFSEAAQIPLKEGIDILVILFRESTFERTMSETTAGVERYLNLLKAHWLVNILSDSEALRQTRLGHLNRRIINKIKQNIAKEYAREEVKQWIRDCEINLENLDDSPFAIWPEKKIELPPLETEPNIGEEKLVQLALVPQCQYQKEELLVFGDNDCTLRIVQSQTYYTSENQQRTRLPETTFNLKTDRLVPLYTIASSPDKKWCLQISSGLGARIITLELQNRADAFKLQTAFTGYQVASHCENVSCGLTYRVRRFNIRKVQSEVHGEVQLWEWPEPKRTPVAPPEVDSQPSAQSLSSGSVATSFFEEIDPSILTITEKTIVAAMPRPPLLMVFTKDDKKYTMCEIDDLEVTQSDAERFRIVLEHGKKSIFTTRKLSVPVTETQTELGSWNLCALAIPGYSADKNKENLAVESLQCTYIVLDFKTSAAYARFEMELEYLLERHRRQSLQFEYSQVGAESLQVQRSGSVPSIEGQNRRSSNASSTLTGALGRSAPVLPPIESMSSLTLSLEHSEHRSRSAEGWDRERDKES
ncbi:hypothetical protein V496_01535 [Pseudogymnoascus sp. VKM F-4515 (FW-2607)]|nr:hypothetical protein V496_01535 [Pseudogymnoascus sp. VKM F-4515 (FW-2607)]